MAAAIGRLQVRVSWLPSPLSSLPKFTPTSRRSGRVFFSFLPASLLLNTQNPRPCHTCFRRFFEGLGVDYCFVSRLELHLSRSQWSLGSYSCLPLRAVREIYKRASLIRSGHLTGYHNTHDISPVIVTMLRQEL